MRVSFRVADARFVVCNEIMQDGDDDSVIISSTEHTPKKQNDEQTAAPARRRGVMAQMRLEDLNNKKLIANITNFFVMR